MSVPVRVSRDRACAPVVFLDFSITSTVDVEDFGQKLVDSAVQAFSKLIFEGSAKIDYVLLHLTVKVISHHFGHQPFGASDIIVGVVR